MANSGRLSCSGWSGRTSSRLTVDRRRRGAGGADRARRASSGGSIGQPDPAHDRRQFRPDWRFWPCTVLVPIRYEQRRLRNGSTFKEFVNCFLARVQLCLRKLETNGVIDLADVAVLCRLLDGLRACKQFTIGSRSRVHCSASSAKPGRQSGGTRCVQSRIAIRAFLLFSRPILLRENDWNRSLVIVAILLDLSRNSA